MKPDLKKNRETDSYMDLVRELSLRPIRNEAEYDRATVVLHRLAVLGEKKLNAGQSDYLDALSVFVEKYDDEHYPIDTSSITPLKMLQALVADHEMPQTKLAELLGIGPGAVSMILAGKRPITASHAKSLGKRFKVDPGLFI